ncbi:MAG: tRNA (adenosine(37)-N6)-threonylcarbamoyltransferase complex transferase subunit TsaD [Thermodesulfobacteriota bacterium]
MLILGIESSCDETAAAVLRDGREVLASVVNSQVAVHSPYGGVVPELASRRHLENILPVATAALGEAGISLDEVDGLAVTQGPGLVGSLLVGLSFAKALSLVRDIPYVCVDHIAGHLLSVFLEEEPPDFPYIALVVSGGHSSICRVSGHASYELLGRTKDDAAGEAFDKVAKILGLPYPGGPAVSELAREGDRRAIDFPRAWLDSGSLDFSFSGVKTAVANYVMQHRQRGTALPLADICASFQEAVVEVLIRKALAAAAATGISNVVLAGGVAANPRLREDLREQGAAAGVRVCLPSPAYCTDNAAMIALAGHYRFKEAIRALDTDVYSRSHLGRPPHAGPDKHSYGGPKQGGVQRPC